MPGTTFLPLAGPLGTVLGVLAGAAVMVVLAWNYHYMVRRMPSAGGTFTFVLRMFGGDHGPTKATGACGLLLSIAIFAIFIVPNYFSGTMISTESYLILVLWSILGFFYYLHVLRRDDLQRYGRSLVVWIALIVLILVMSHWDSSTTCWTCRSSSPER